MTVVSRDFCCLGVVRRIVGICRACGKMGCLRGLELKVVILGIPTTRGFGGCFLVLGIMVSAGVLL